MNDETETVCPAKTFKPILDRIRHPSTDGVIDPEFPVEPDVILTVASASNVEVECDPLNAAMTAPW